MNGHHVPASGKSQISVPDSADSGVELSVSGQYMPEMTPVLEHEEEEYEDMTSRRILGFFVCLFDLIFYVPSTIFQLNRDGSSWVGPVLS